jgi:signal transduction histidine kinase
MTGLLPAVLAFLGNSREFTEAAAAITTDPVQGAVRLARALHHSWPAPLSACLLRLERDFALHALDAKGTHRPEWETPLSKLLIPWLEQNQTEPVYLGKPPSGVSLRTLHLLAVPIISVECRLGLLITAATAGKHSARGRLAQELLRHQANDLALLLGQRPAETTAAARSEASSELLGNFVDLAYMVTHEFNNLLNNMLLQVAVLQHSGAAGSARGQLEMIQQVGARAAGMIREFQQFSRKLDPPHEPVDLQAAVREAVVEMAAGGPVELDLADDLPPVLGSLADLKRLAGLLVENARAASEAGARTVVRTQRTGGQVLLTVEDTGPRVSDEALQHLFEPFSTARAHGDGWRLAVCKAIARRLQGNVRAEHGPSGGVSIIVQLRPGYSRSSG